MRQWCSIIHILYYSTEFALGQNDEDQKVSTPDTTLPENGVKMPSVEVRCIEEHKQRDCMGMS